MLSVSFSRVVVTLPDKGCAQRPAGPVSALGAGPPAACTVPRPRRRYSAAPVFLPDMVSSSASAAGGDPPPAERGAAAPPDPPPPARAGSSRRAVPPARLGAACPRPGSPPRLPASPLARSPSRPSPVLYLPRSRLYCLSASLSLSFLSLPAHAAWCASDRRQRRAARRLRARRAQRRRSGSRRLGHLAGAAGSAAMARPTPPAPLSSQTPRPGGSSLSRPGPEAVSLRAPVSARGAAPPVTPRPSPAARPQPGAHTKRRSAITRRGPVHHLIPSPRAPTRAPSPPRPKNTAPDSSLSEGVCGGTVLITRFAREI